MWNGSENQIKLVMIRHGATKSNAEHRYLGKTDEALMDESIRRLLEKKMQGVYPEAEYIFCSPMKRCLETARILYPDKPAVQIPEWTEMDFGAFEGKNYMELQGDKWYQEWIDSNGTLPFPEGESREAFILRSKEGLYRMYEQLRQMMGAAKQQKVPSVGMVVHGGTIMSLISTFYGGEYFDYQVSNGGGYLCTLKDLGSELKITDITGI